MRPISRTPVSPRFTEPEAADVVPFAIDVRRLPEAMQDDLAECVGIAQKSWTQKKLESSLANRERTLTALRALPAYALLILEAVCEARGRITRRDLERAFKDRGLDVRPLQRGLEYLLASGLVLVTGRDAHDGISLISPTAAIIHDLVLGVSHPTQAPPGPPLDADVLLEERHVFAVTTLVAHRRLRWTLDGLPNKTSLRGFAKGLGPSEERIDALLIDAHKADLIDETEDGSTPRARSLLRAAVEGPSWPARSLVHEVDALLPKEGWIPLRVVLPHLREYGIATEKDLAARCAGHFALCEHGGHGFVGRPLRPQTRTGDGHVTPNFEVMLGPDAHPEVVVFVGLFAELVRLDRVLTFKITEASVLAGLRTGCPLESFLQALRTVGKHGIPDNVAITVEAFASRTATARRLWALEVPESATAALLRELDDPAAFSPRAGLVLVPRHFKEKALADALVRAGLKPIPVSDEGATDEREAPATPRGVARLPMPDAGLRDAVERERREQFAPSVKALDGVYPPFAVEPGRDAEWSVQRAIGEIEKNGGPPLVRRAFERLAELIAGVPGELEAWAKGLAPAHATQARAALQSPFELIPIASVVNEERTRLLARSRTLAELVQLSERALIDGRMKDTAPRVLAAFATLGPPPVNKDKAGRPPLPSSSDSDSVVRLVAGPMLHRHLDELIELEAVIKVAVRTSRNSSQEWIVYPTSLSQRGNELVLLAEDVRTSENYAIPLSKLEWIEADLEPGEDELNA
jgi:hypothetical protein